MVKCENLSLALLLYKNAFDFLTLNVSAKTGVDYQHKRLCIAYNSVSLEIFHDTLIPNPIF